MKKIAWLLIAVLGLGISLFAEDMGKATRVGKRARSAGKQPAAA